MNYESNHAVLPPACSDTTVPAGTGVQNDFSMKGRVLPYLEQGAVYNSLNMFDYSTDPTNWTAMCIQINSFLCPSDGNVPIGTRSVALSPRRQDTPAIPITSGPSPPTTTAISTGRRT